MADWKVSREQIELFSHNNAEKLELGKLGQYQIVVQKGLYKNGDVVIFIPHGSILPDVPEFEGFKPYLTGPLKNRVKSQSLRSELSCGIALPDKEEFKDIPIGEDISAKLNIIRYEPEVPAQLKGNVKPIGHIDTSGKDLTHHDCDQFNINRSLIDETQDILVTEKLHGSSLVYVKTIDNRDIVTSKGLFKRYLTLEEKDENFYWQAIKNSGLIELAQNHWPNKHVQIFSEALPCQKGFHYNYNKPNLRIFRIEVDGSNLPISEISNEFLSMWVPILYRGQFDIGKIESLRHGSETLSGKQTSIREGIVISNLKVQKDKHGSYIYLKLLNPKYKETGEEFN